MPPGVTIVGGSPVPNDYELAKIYGYTPVTHGWIVGRKTEQEPGVSVEPVSDLSGFGRAAPSLGQETVETQLKLMNEQLKTLQWNRVCSAIGAGVGALALIVSVISITRRR
jgi:hypothetical protein